MKVAIGCDHGGFPFKEVLVKELESLGHAVHDCGAQELSPEDDYPDFARSVGLAIQRGQAERGVLICGSGVGANVAANKMDAVRAALCHDTYSAHQGVEHDDMNVLCLGARVIGIELAKELVRAFMSARFIGEGRFQRRLDKVLAIEKEQAHAIKPTAKR